MVTMSSVRSKLIHPRSKSTKTCFKIRTLSGVWEWGRDARRATVNESLLVPKPGLAKQKTTRKWTEGGTEGQGEGQSQSSPGEKSGKPKDKNEVDHCKKHNRLVRLRIANGICKASRWKRVFAWLINASDSWPQSKDWRIRARGMWGVGECGRDVIGRCTPGTGVRRSGGRQTHRRDNLNLIPFYPPNLSLNSKVTGQTWLWNLSVSSNENAGTIKLIVYTSI